MKEFAKICAPQMPRSALPALVKPLVVPPLHEGFSPAVLANHAYLKAVRDCSHGVPLTIALERQEGFVSVYKTACFDERHEASRFNLPFAERLVKMLLWKHGGWRIVVGGPRHVGEHILQTYSPQGARAFDAEFMGGVYERPFTVEITSPEKTPQPSEGTMALGRHLDGCRIGFDLGATDRKVAAVIDGEPVFTEEVVWDPRNAADPSYHYNEIMAGLKSVAQHLPRVDAIGGSAAGIYINNRPRVASLFRAVPRELFVTGIVNLFLDMQRAWGGIPFEVVNDGEVTALAGSMSLQDNAVLGIALGSSEAAGYVTETGELSTWLNELAFCPVDYDPAAPVDEWSGDRGCGAQYFSQQAVFRLAAEAGINLDERLGPAQKLKSVQEMAHDGEAQARQIFETIGCYVGYGIAHYADFYALRNVLILGRVTSGEGGNIILSRAQEVLLKEFPELAQGIRLWLPDEATRRVGQAVAAASLPAVGEQGIGNRE
jgi:predicted NBD/HSP70 family sugar kinase